MKKRNLLVGVVVAELLCAVAYVGLMQPSGGQGAKADSGFPLTATDHKDLSPELLQISEPSYTGSSPDVVDERHYTSKAPTQKIPTITIPDLTIAHVIESSTVDERSQKAGPDQRGLRDNPKLENVRIAPLGILKEGDTLTVTASGSPDCTCTFTIEGLAADQPMDVSSPGKYGGTYLVTETDTKIDARTAVTICSASGEKKTVTSDKSVTIDGSAPMATNFAPPPDSEIHNRQPFITAMFDDGSGTGVDDKSVKLWVNGKDVTKSTEIKGGAVKYQPKAPFKDQEVKVHLKLADKAKNVTDYNWTFTFAK